jgi:hypothetical protein
MSAWRTAFAQPHRRRHAICVFFFTFLRVSFHRPNRSASPPKGLSSPTSPPLPRSRGPPPHDRHIYRSGPSALQNKQTDAAARRGSSSLAAEGEQEWRERWGHARLCSRWLHLQLLCGRRSHLEEEDRGKVCARQDNLVSAQDLHTSLFLFLGAKHFQPPSATKGEGNIHRRSDFFFGLGLLLVGGEGFLVSSFPSSQPASQPPHQHRSGRAGRHSRLSKARPHGR